jgi:AcrR family transcriptional regulator
MSPKIVDKKAKKNEIAWMALNLFVEQGFEATSISKIAKAANIGKGTIYEYYENKEDLIFSSAFLLIEQLENLLQITMDKSEDIEERIRKGTKELIKAIISDDKMTKITVAIMQLVITNQDFFSQHKVIQKFYNGFYKTISDTLMEGIKNGKFRPDVEKDVQLIAVNFLAYIDGILIHYYMDKDYFDLEKQVDFYIDNLLNSLRISK